MAPASASDGLADTVDYGEVATRAAAVVAGPPFELLEALAGSVARWPWLRTPGSTSVTVHLRKLRPPLALDVGSVGVRITRGR